MKDAGLFSKAHGGNTVVLSDHNIAGFCFIGDGKIHTVGTLVDDSRFGAFTDDPVGGIREKDAGNVVLSAKIYCNVYNRTAVRVD